MIGFGALLCMLVVACGKPESRLVGKWAGRTGSIEFFKNKTGVINPPPGANLPLNTPFTWSVQGSDTVKMDVGAPAGRTTFGKLEGKDSLIVEDDKFIKLK